MMMPSAVLIEATVVSAPMDAGCAAGADAWRESRFW